MQQVWWIQVKGENESDAVECGYTWPLITQVGNPRMSAAEHAAASFTPRLYPSG